MSTDARKGLTSARLPLELQQLVLQHLTGDIIYERMQQAIEFELMIVACTNSVYLRGAKEFTQKLEGNLRASRANSYVFGKSRCLFLCVVGRGFCPGRTLSFRI